MELKLNNMKKKKSFKNKKTNKKVKNKRTIRKIRLKSSDDMPNNYFNGFTSFGGFV